MNKGKKSFDWYGTRQHFSIRKYHFGAASVLLGLSLATGAQVAKAEEVLTATTTIQETVASTTETSASSTSSVAPTETATASTVARNATINYIVQYVLEDGTLVKASLATTTVTTQEAIATTDVTLTAELPEGYDLVSGQETTVTQTVNENAENVITIKVVQKAEVVEGTTEATAPTAVATTPSTVEGAKTVLEQVISEAEVLANEAERLVAVSGTDNPTLTAAAIATKLVVTDATTALTDAVASLEQVNAQIDAVRSNVEALALELRKFYPNGDIVALLNTSTSTTASSSLDVNNPNSIYYAQHGEWYIPDPVKAANSGLPVGDQPATITEAVKTLPDGYIGDQDANRDTFLILNLDTKDGYGDGNNFNDWVGKNYYVVFSVSTIASEREANDVVYAKLVEKTATGSTVVNTITLTPGVSNTFTELRVLEGNATRNTTYGFTYNVQTVNGGTTRTLTINNTNGNNKNTFLYNKLEAKRVGEEFTIATANVTGSTTQTTTYYVKENEATERPREMLAKYTQTDGLIGDNFHIAGALDFNNYELLATELPSVTSGTLKSDYVVGTQTLQLRPNGNEARLITITDLDGSVQQQIYMLDPNNPNWSKFYKTSINNATLSDLKDYFKLMFTSEVLPPGAYNTKEGTFSEKFYEASKLVLESTVVQVMDVNGDVLGTLSDDKSTITTKHGATLPVASTTDSMVTGADGTIYLINYHKIYKTDSAGNYVDANGNVLTPIIWDVATPSNPFVPGIYGPSVSGTDTVTISTGPLTATTYPEAIWYFGYNYKTSSTETRLKDGETDSRWDLGGTELGMRNSNAKNEQHARYWYVEKGGVEVYYIDTDGNVFTNFTAPDSTTVTDKVTLVGHGDTDSAYDTTTVRYEKITAADGTVYWYKAIDTTTANLHPVVNDTTDTDYRANEKIDAETGKIATDTVKQITYVYEKAGSVIVNYVDQDGKPLEGITDAGATTASTVTDTDNGKAGSTYDTKDLKPNTITTADGKIYRLVPAATKGDETGTVVSGETKEVTYVYQLVKGDVIVHYVDTDGNTIADTVTDQTVIETGTAYNTTDNKPEKIVNDTTGDVYYIMPKGSEIQAGSAAETGKVVEGTTEVTYVYQKAGNVKVNYTLADGTVIKDPVFDETNQKPGYDYNTADNKPETITTKDGKVYKLVPTATIGNETGDVEAGKTTEVTYIYEEVVSDVVVEYYDTAGKAIAKTVIDTDDASVGTVYNTDEDNRPNTIETDAGVVYYYKEVKDTSAPTTGKVAETTTTVQYVYEKAGDVIVHYIATDGTPISGVTNTGAVTASTVDDTVNGKPGSTYDTSDLRPTTIITDEGKTYELIPTATIGNETGNVVSGQTTEVTYVYKEVKGSVVVNYITTDGTVIQDPVTDTSETSTGTDYDTKDHKPTVITTKDGKSYRLVPALTQGSETGEVVPGVTNITYVYEEIKGDVVVNYVNTDGDVIASQVVDTKLTSTGTAYNTTDHKPAKITTADDVVYYYKEVKAGDNETGKVVEGTTEVTYIYEQAGSVTVNYVTTDGKVIKSPVKDEVNAKPGSPYDTTDNKPTTITTDDGKTYELIPTATIGNETGEVEAGKTTEVTYVYKEVKGSVVVNYITTDGTVLQDPVTDTPETSTGTGYDTKDNKPTVITTKDGKSYRLVPNLTQGSETGKVVPGVTQVTYVYEEIKGDVVVNYVNTDGKVIASQVVDTKLTSTGTDYSTTDNKPEKIVEDATGDVYYIMPTGSEIQGGSAAETGKVVEGTTEVTYVYQKAGNVKVNYTLADGTVIKDPVFDETNQKPGYGYNTTDNKPETITTTDGKVYRLVPTATVGNETGDVESGKTIEVTYIYEEVKSDVVVEYYDTLGIVIAKTVTDTDDASVGTVYNTDEDNRPDTITTDAGVVYYYKEVKDTSASTTGKVAEATTTVQYVYEQAGNVVVNYVTTDGIVIKTPVKDEVNAKPGSPYDTTDNKPNTITTEDGKVYRLVPNKTTGEENGTVTSGEDKQITYVYEEVTSDVVVEYYNTDGDIIATTVIDEDDASVGKAYNTDEDNRPDTITATDGTVYYYKEVKDTSASTTGKVAETTTTVQYVYEKAGSVTVNYVTTDGIVIKTPIKDKENAKPGSPYDTTDNKPNTITTEDGKTYRLVPSKTTGEENGTITSGEDKQVTYVYEEVKGDVVVEYYDTKRNLISGLSETGAAIDSTEVDTPLSSTGTAYNTDEDNRPSTITTADGKVYYYKAVKDTSAATTGKVVEGTTTVQYVYEEAGNVVINYITEDGTVIKIPVNDETNAVAGKSYDTTDNKPNTITTADGTVYELIPSATIGNENGSVTSGQTTQVTYVYKKVETPKTVITDFVDEDGNVISPREDGSTPNKSIKGYEYVRTVVDKDGNTTHIYKKVTKTKSVITDFVDEDGNVISPREDGSTPNKSIEGYEYVRTVVDKDGNTTHIYRKVSNTPSTEPGKPTSTTPVSKSATGTAVLPNTGEETGIATALGLGLLGASLGLVMTRRRKED